MGSDEPIACHSQIDVWNARQPLAPTLPLKSMGIRHAPLGNSRLSYSSLKLMRRGSTVDSRAIGDGFAAVHESGNVKVFGSRVGDLGTGHSPPQKINASGHLPAAIAKTLQKGKRGIHKSVGVGVVQRIKAAL